MEEFKKVRAEANLFKRANRIDATERFVGIFETLYLNKVFYEDFYRIPKFGKTRLGQFILPGKQAQDRKLMRFISDEAKSIIEAVCTDEKIDAVAWAPHSLTQV